MLDVLEWRIDGEVIRAESEATGSSYRIYQQLHRNSISGNGAPWAMFTLTVSSEGGAPLSCNSSSLLALIERAELDEQLLRERQ